MQFQIFKGLNSTEYNTCKEKVAVVLIIGLRTYIQSIMYKKFFKRVIDFFVALFILILSLPILLIVSVLLLIQNKSQVFFIQERPGYKQKKIHIYKFKTMTDERDENGELLPDVQRLTKLGNLIRRLSIDELPQLINVLKGDMSLVGPRPLLMKYLPLYSKEQLRRHDVLPGITGWAQVNGRNSINWVKKFELDIYYVEHQSFLLDMKIFWMTLLKIINREGVNLNEDVTMTEFDGTN